MALGSSYINSAFYPGPCFSESVEVSVMLSSASTATVHAAHAATLEEHLENVVRVHSSHATTSSSLIYFVNVGPFVIHLAFFLVG